ncbi:MAG: 5-demethoxyubiquinol-8 5-hydroxylase UbiM [Gammaproteobacteria bacterium]
MNFDIIVIGAGPAGLCFARSLSGSGLSVALLESRDVASLGDPDFDGREIALTHHSIHLLRQLGIWERIPPDRIHVLRDALVMDGNVPLRMSLEHTDSHRSQLGFLVANQEIRRAAFAATLAQDNLTLICGQRVSSIEPGRNLSRVGLADGRSMTARLVVAADSRFSESRRAMGIAADSHDFGKTMMVCRMDHEQAHDQVAWEWFGQGQTLALLPLSGHQSSVVITLPPVAIRTLMEAPEAEFDAAIEARFHRRLGWMRLASTRHAYPLVAVYARTFTAERFALVGDAAVGMHPFTAHGFNFGLLGKDLLAGAIHRAQAARWDIGGPQELAQYARALRRATRPLYLATGAIARLYTDDRRPARLVRRTALVAGAGLRPLRRALVDSLTQAGDSDAATYPFLGMLRALRHRLP